MAFVTTFTKRREELELSLTIHTSVGVDSANAKLNEIAERQKQFEIELQAKMDLMIKAFSNFATPQQREMERFITKKGGVEIVLKDEKLLKEVNEHKSNQATTATIVHATGAGGGKSGVPSAAITKPKATVIDELKEELQEPDAALAKNIVSFSRKFDEQQRQITEELTKVISREGDRVISAITSGPHDRILGSYPICSSFLLYVMHLLDPDVYNVWRDSVSIIFSFDSACNFIFIEGMARECQS